MLQEIVARTAATKTGNAAAAVDTREKQSHVCLRDPALPPCSQEQGAPTSEGLGSTNLDKVPTVKGNPFKKLKEQKIEVLDTGGTAANPG